MKLIRPEAFTRNTVTQVTFSIRKLTIVLNQDEERGLKFLAISDNWLS